jgi:hypothetical protein
MLSFANACRKLCPVILFLSLLLTVFAFTSHQILQKGLPRMKIDSNCKPLWDIYKADVFGKLKTATKQLAKFEAIQLRKKTLNRQDSTELSFLKKQVAILNATIDNLALLEKSTQLYLLKDTSQNPAKNEGGTVYEAKSDAIVFYVANAASFVHETTHGGQYERGEQAYDSLTRGPRANDLYDEVAAYRAEFAFDATQVKRLSPSSKLESFEAITALWVNDLTGPNDSHPYSDTGTAKIGRIFITINSTKGALYTAYHPWDPSWLKKFDPSCTLKSCYPNLKYKHPTGDPIQPTP